MYWQIKGFFYMIRLEPSSNVIIFCLASVTWYVIMCSDKYFSVLAYEIFFPVIGRERILHVVMGLWTRSNLVFLGTFAGNCGFCCGALVGWVRTHAVFFIIMHLVL